MKIRTDFVTNSSSSSFVICKNDLPEDIRDKVISYIENHFTHAEVEDMNEMYKYCEFYDTYYLVGYQKDDPYMHVWVTRDEYMDDEFIDNILYEYKDCSIPAKYDEHY